MSSIGERSKDDVYKFSREIKLNFKLNTMEEGDQNGKIHKYGIFRKSKEFLSENPVKSNQISNQKIDFIKQMNIGKDLLVIANNSLYYVDGEDLKIKNEIIKGNVISVVINDSKQQQHEVLVQMKNKLTILEFDNKTGDFQKEKQSIPLNDTPITLAFLGNLIFYGSKNNYYKIDLNDKFQLTNVKILISSYPFIKVTDYDELFFTTTTNNIGVLVGRDCNAKNKSPYDAHAKPFISIQISKPFLIILYDGCFQIFNSYDSKILQETDITGGGVKKLIVSQGNLIYATQLKLVIFDETPFEVRIKESLKLGKIEEAQAIFNSSISNDDSQYKEKEERFSLDAAWALVEQARFKDANQKFENRETDSIRDFDVRELLALFKEFILLDMLGRITINNNKNISVIIGKVQDQKRRETLEKDATEMLINVLEKMRHKYNKTQYKQLITQKMTYYTSPYTLSQQNNDLELQDILKLIDYALIKIYLKKKDTKKLCDLFKGKYPIYCKGQFDEIYRSLLDEGVDQKDPQVIAFFYEKFDRIKDALDTWKLIGEGNEKGKKIGDGLQKDEALEKWEKTGEGPQRYDIACKETIRILLDQEDQQKIRNYHGWVIRKNIKYAKQFFTDIKESVISPDQMLDFIHNSTQYNQTQTDQILAEKLRETYLEIIITKKKVDESRYHNLLALFPKETKASDVKLTDAGIKLYKKFEQYYSDPNAKYEPSYLLERVQDSWLVEEEIYFCGKSKMHQKALQKLIIILNRYSDAEQYCLKHNDPNDMTLTVMFKIYMDIYKTTNEFLQQKGLDQEQKSNVQQLNQIWINRINIFLKKYSTHPLLDIFEVLKNIPDNWILTEFIPPVPNEINVANDGLYSFLTQIISASLHNRRQVNCAKQLSEMDLQNVKCNLINTKKAYVKISEEKKCAICHKNVGDKAVCIYPNSVVADQKCVINGQSLTICPLTSQDFEKTFKG